MIIISCWLKCMKLDISTGLYSVYKRTRVKYSFKILICDLLILIVSADYGPCKHVETQYMYTKTAMIRQFLPAK